MTDRRLIRLSDLPKGAPFAFDLAPEDSERAAIAEALGIPAVKKLTFTGDLRPAGRQDWTLSARLGATVVQPCVVTLDPVTSRIDEEVRRTFVADFSEPEGGEVEMPEDDSLEPLPETLDLGRVMTEALLLALPPYPRSEGAELGEANFTEPGKRAMTDEDAKPLAGLSALRDKLGKGS